MLHGVRRGGTWMAVLVAALLSVPGIAVAAGFDDPSSNDSRQQLDTLPPPAPYGPNVQRQDTPNDPSYDQAEPDDPNPPAQPSTNIFDERFDLFGFASERTRAEARYSDPGNGPGKVGRAMVSGFNAAGAWKISRGLPSVEVAILDTGINWDTRGLRDQVALNREELPPPQPPNPGAGLDGYDLNANGRLDVDDYKNDPRVGKAAPTGQDLIRAFSNNDDADTNGYVDDIAGWDFFDDDNDPQDTSSYFAAKNHGSGRTTEAVEKGNDGEGSIGVCPKCTYVPLRVWDTFVSDQNNFFLAVVYATDNGVEVIEGADGGLYHSAFSEQASEYAYRHGVSQVYSGDDLNTANHNYPANYNHTMLIEGTSADAKGLGMNVPSDERDPGFRAGLIAAANRLGLGIALGTSVPVRTYFRGANTTQFGGHSSISMEGATGSTNTGKAAGAVALVIAAARQKGIELSADETRELLEQTAEDILPGDTVGTGVPDPAQPGFETHFGYGRANVGDAVKAAADGRIPPEASIGTPDWYAPLAGDEVRVTGLARARSGLGAGGFTWRLEFGLGLAPTAWSSVRQGTSGGPAVTDFGTLPLAEIRQQVLDRQRSDNTAAAHPDRDDPAGPVLDKTDPKLDPFQGQFTIRLVVTSNNQSVLEGVDRKVLTAIGDPTLRPSFPKDLGTGGEAPLRYSDLNGDNRQELVLPTEDGLVHAFRSDGSELPGWPVRTRLQYSSERHVAAPGVKELSQSGTPPLEAPRAPTIADLTGDGLPEVITAAGERLYAWDFQGRELPGFPVRPDPERRNCALSEQRKESGKKVDGNFLAGRHPKCGFLSTPAVGRLEGPAGGFDIVAPDLDGRLYAYRADGTPVPGFPVRLIDPDVPDNEKVTAESINQPAIGDLDGDGRDDIVIPTNEVYGGSGSTGGDVSFGAALAQAGTQSRVYAVKSTGTRSAGRPFFPGWPIKLGGIIQDVLPLIGPGHDPSLVKIAGQQQQIVVSTTGGQLSLYGVNGQRTREINQNVGNAAGALNLFESAAVGDLNGSTGGRDPDLVKYQIDIAQATNLLLVGQNQPYSHRIGAFDAANGEPVSPAYPVITEDYQFLSSSTIGNVTGGETNQVLAGTALGLLHAYDGVTGRDPAGFPKVTGGWLFAPAALSDDGRLAAVTREGFLFEWDAKGAPACQPEWPAFRHDQQGTGNYDADGTPPAAPDRLSLERVEGNSFRLSFHSPGDDGFCGTATRYVADVDGQAIDLGPPVEGGKTFSKTISVPAGARRVTIRAADGPVGQAFNLGAPGILERQAGGGGGGGGGGFVAVPAPGADPSATPGVIPRPLLPGGLRAGRCANQKTGTNRSESLRGTAAGDRILGLLGADVIRGGRGADCLSGGGGKDRLLGEKGADSLAGGTGSDRLSGRGGADVLRGGSGKDRLVGGTGRDRFIAGAGNDRVNARDRVRETVNCGGGRHDLVLADLRDRVARNCERVQRRG